MNSDPEPISQPARPRCQASGRLWWWLEVKPGYTESYRTTVWLTEIFWISHPENVVQSQSRTLSLSPSHKSHSIVGSSVLIKVTIAWLCHNHCCIFMVLSISWPLHMCQGVFVCVCMHVRERTCAHTHTEILFVLTNQWHSSCSEKGKCLSCPLFTKFQGNELVLYRISKVTNSFLEDHLRTHGQRLRDDSAIEGTCVVALSSYTEAHKHLQLQFPGIQHLLFASSGTGIQVANT